MVTEQEIRELIKTIGLPKIISDIYDEAIEDEEIQELIGYDYHLPSSIIELNKDVQMDYQVNRYKPVLALSSSQIIAYDTQSKGFISYDPEIGIEDTNPLTWEGVMLEEVTIWWENEFEEEELLKLSKAFEIKNAEEIFQRLEIANENGQLSTTEGKDRLLETMLDDFNLRVS